MDLKTLFEGLGPRRHSGADPKALQISGLAVDSRRVRPGFLYVADKGTAQDGHDYLSQALSAGAVALFVADPRRVPKEFGGPVYVADHPKQLVSALAGRFFGQPSEKLYCVGVTGTNGKTTSVYMIEQIFTALGEKTGVMGTIDHHLGRTVWPSALTTPDPIDLQSRLAEFKDSGASSAAMEVSSHALSQGRADGVSFDAAIFTNFTRDHLDYHSTMASYFEAKSRLFNTVLAHSRKEKILAVLNADDPQIRSLKVADRVQTLWFGETDQAQMQFQILEETLTGTRFLLKTPNSRHEFILGCPGGHNVSNAVGALSVAWGRGWSLDRLAPALKDFSGAPGRLQTVANTKGLHVFVDYAHTDDALKTVLTMLKKIMVNSKSAGRLWIVFGCGGDRDRGKRPLMARVACELSDRVVITSDNPRTEEPMTIIDDCLRGVSGKTPERDLWTEVDRRKAISFALQTAREGDVILIAGKGHETYQIIGAAKHDFDDVRVAQEILGSAN